MSMSDPIADLLTRVRNASKAKKGAVTVSFSTINQSILEIFKSEGYIKDFKIENLAGTKKEIIVDLKYVNKQAAFKELKRISRPGRRIYIASGDIKPVYNNMGLGILSTSHGVMTSVSARRQGVGGEFLCQIF